MNLMKEVRNRIGGGIATVGLIITGLGSIQVGNTSGAIDKKLSDIGDKLTGPQIEQLTELKQNLIAGGNDTMIGEGVAAAAVGYMIGKAANKKQKQEPDRSR